MGRPGSDLPALALDPDVPLKVLRRRARSSRVRQPRRSSVGKVLSRQRVLRMGAASHIDPQTGQKPPRVSLRCGLLPDATSRRDDTT